MTINEHCPLFDRLIQGNPNAILVLLIIAKRANVHCSKQATFTVHDFPFLTRGQYRRALLFLQKLQLIELTTLGRRGSVISLSSTELLPLPEEKSDSVRNACAKRAQSVRITKTINSDISTTSNEKKNGSVRNACVTRAQSVPKKALFLSAITDLIEYFNNLTGQERQHSKANSATIAKILHNDLITSAPDEGKYSVNDVKRAWAYTYCCWIDNPDMKTYIRISSFCTGKIGERLDDFLMLSTEAQQEVMLGTWRPNNKKLKSGWRRHIHEGEELIIDGNTETKIDYGGVSYTVIRNGKDSGLRFGIYPDGTETLFSG